jgi:hypothetical protein
LLQPFIIAEELLKRGKIECDMIEARLACATMPVGCRARGEGPGVNESDAMVLVVVADEADMGGLLYDFSAQNFAIPVAHLGQAVCVENDVRHLAR